jgi:type I protein arginine methyltransferase
MYSFANYGEMIADRHRLEAYAAAIRRVVRPGSVVLDLGAGPGIMTLIACQAGARKVYALDSADAVQFVKQAARANGFADRVEVIQQNSIQVNLPEPANVIVSDISGVLPLLGPAVVAIMDARERLLAPGGRLIPHSERLWAAVVEAPDAYGRRLGPWQCGPFGLDLRAALPLLYNDTVKMRAVPQQLLTEAQSWALLSYDTVASPHVQGTVRWAISRQGTAHGVLLWFDSVLVEDVGFSNAPAAPALIYGQLFLPWPEPVAVAEGDLVEVALRAQLVGEKYVWCWNSKVCTCAAPAQVRCHFQQSTFQSTLLSAERLRKTAAGFVPTLSEEARVHQFVLERLQGPGAKTLGDLARELAERFPLRFPTWERALSFLGALSVNWRL